MVNYALEGPKWTTSTITWDFAAAGNTAFTNAIDPAYQATIRAAAAQWAAATHLNLQEVAPGTPGADITVGWGSFTGSQIGETEYSYATGSSQSFLPGMTIHIEDPSLLPLSATAGALYQGTSTTLAQVALHEFGHALGLGLSTDPNAVMNIRLGTGNTAISASDLAGIDALYGTQAAVSALPSTQAAVSALPGTQAGLSALPASTGGDTVSLNGSSIGVYRFFDGSNGTQFLTSSVSEMNSIFASRSDMSFEGLAMAGIPTGSADPAATPLYRFYDTSNGAHFFTASATEAAGLAKTRPDMVAEQPSFDEHITQQTGDVPVYRFFDKDVGTHFFTTSATEQATLAATRTDMTYEGIAFYAPAQS